jgi:Fe-S-cluster containining protein
MKRAFVQVLQGYELLVDRADGFFQKVKQTHGACVKCEPHCSDCCHAVFGLFLIEAAYLKGHFDELNGEKIKEALLRCNDTERALKRLEMKLKAHEADPQMGDRILATERIRCPLLDNNLECILYPHRPITCRVYGIPTKIHGKPHVCGNSGFEKDRSYPAFDLDGVYRDLFSLSKELLEGAGEEDLDKASLLISVGKAIRTPFDDLINETFRGPGEESP